MFQGKQILGYLCFMSTVLLYGGGFSAPISTAAPIDVQPDVAATAIVQWIVRVSVASDGTQGNDYSQEVAISGDGRYVAFSSTADNLVVEDTNECRDIFVHDLHTRKTVRISVSPIGWEANATSSQPYISADGRYVAFASRASNLVASDTNDTEDIFVHDLKTGKTTRVSVSTAGEEAKERSYAPSLSGDGRYVAFISSASNLIVGDTNSCDNVNSYANGHCPDIFVHDRQTGTTQRVSVTDNGQQADGESGYDSRPGVSDDGRYVVFNSWANTLAGRGANSMSMDRIYVRDRENNLTEIVSLDPGFSWYPSISADGQHAAFLSNTPNNISGEENICRGNNQQSCYHVYVRDLETDVLVRASVNSQGRQGLDGYSKDPQISADGNYVVFASAASDLAPNDTNNFCDNNADRQMDDSCYDIFLHDLTTSETFRVSVTPDGGEGNNNSRSPSVSAQGDYVAFVSIANNLVEDDTNDAADIFVVGLTQSSLPPFRVKSNDNFIWVRFKAVKKCRIIRNNNK